MKMERIIECVPNFSEGRNMDIIGQITGTIGSVDGVELLDMDPGKATNRTVVTFVGEPDAVVEAAFLAVQKAAALIDMRVHQGEHPRFGATDVCPLVPVTGITMEETVEYARQLAGRIGKELGIPVYCYENAALHGSRRNLAAVRAGEYEGLKDKLSKKEWEPDFGPAEFVPRTGAIAVGARDFLVAYNINLNTTSTRRANAVAFDVRERGRVKRKGDPLTGEIVRDGQGKPVMVPGSLKAVKAIGWFIEEYGIAQISMNLTNISITPLHVAFDEVCRRAEARGMRVTGSELVGMVPLKAMLDAGRYFLRKQNRSTGVPDSELIRIAVKSMGLDELGPFRADEKIIEYRITPKSGKRLADLTVKGFMEETSSESMAPGGGSVSACIGSLGVALGTMVANLSSHKRGWDHRWEEFSGWAEKGKVIQEKLMDLVDKDTLAFNAIISAFRLPKDTEEDKQARRKAVDEATLEAIRVPFEVMKTAFSGYELVGAMVDQGNPSSVTDAGVGALAIHACIAGAWLNVRINSKQMKSHPEVDLILRDGTDLSDSSAAEKDRILQRLENRLHG